MRSLKNTCKLTGSVYVFPLANVEHRDRRGWNHRIGVSTATELVQTKKAEQKMFSFSVGVAGRLQATTNTFISINYRLNLKNTHRITQTVF